MKNSFVTLGTCITGAVLLAQTPFVSVAQDESPLKGNQPLLDDRPEKDFKGLFNGKDLAGWDGNRELWSVKDGAIIGQTTAEHPAKKNTFLIWTNGTVSDFELRCSYKIVSNNDQGFANSGVQYRSKILDPNYWVVGGYQADMEAGSKYSGILYDEAAGAGGRQIMAARGEKVVWDKDCQKQVTGSVGKSEEIQAAVKSGDWNEYVIIAKGNHLQHFINGKLTVDVTDECEGKRLKSGVLALQLHAGQPMTVQFKDIRIKTSSAGGQSSAEELRKLQGEWEIVSAEANGAPIPAEDIGGILVTIRDDTYRVVKKDGTDQGRFTVVPSTQPTQMDIQPESGANGGRTLPAIYEVTPESLRVCYATQGADRPAAFATTADSGLLLINYKRKKQ